jgi:hypothetical protein
LNPAVVAVVFLGFTSIVSGCAFGRKIDYRGMSDLRVAYKIKPSLTIGVLDQRDVKADADDWVGVFKSGFGIPYPVHTASGRGLSADLGELLRDSLIRRFDVKQVVMRAGTEDRTARSLVKPDGEGAGILVTLRRWETSVYMRMVLTYDVGLEVFDSKGASLAFTSQAGEDILQDSNRKRPTLEAAVASIFSELFNNKDVRRALEGPGDVAPPQTVAPAASGSELRQPLRAGGAPAPSQSVPPPPQPAPGSIPEPSRIPARPAAQTAPNAAAKAKCTVDQILKMNEMKFSDAQIKAACD